MYIPIRLKRLPPWAATLLCAVILQAPFAHASSTAGATIDALLFMVDVTSTTGSLSGLSISGSDSVSAGSDIAGAASASSEGFVGFIDDPLGLGVGFDMSVSAYADGAAPNPDGFFDLTALSFGFVDLENTSATETFEISYAFSYTMDAFADITLPGDDAFAFGSLEIDTGDPASVFTSVGADALLGPGTDGASDVISFTVILAPGESASISIAADVAAFGVAAVPVPAALPLLLSGLAGLFGLARRRSALAGA